MFTKTPRRKGTGKAFVQTRLTRALNAVLLAGLLGDRRLDQLANVVGQVL